MTDPITPAWNIVESAIRATLPEVQAILHAPVSGWMDWSEQVARASLPAPFASLVGKPCEAEESFGFSPRVLKWSADVVLVRARELTSGEVAEGFRTVADAVFPRLYALSEALLGSSLTLLEYPSVSAGIDDPPNRALASTRAEFFAGTVSFRALIGDIS